MRLKKFLGGAEAAIVIYGERVPGLELAHRVGPPLHCWAVALVQSGLLLLVYSLGLAQAHPFVGYSALGFHLPHGRVYL